MDDPLLVEGRAPADVPLEWAERRIAAHARGRVLDLGCGDGRFLPPDGVGLDVDEFRLRRATARSRRLVRADAHALPFRDGTFDTVMANRMLNDAGRIDEVIAQAKRVLRANGRFLVLTLARRPRAFLERLHEELGRRAGEPRATDRLDEDNGEERLQRHFARVRVERLSRPRRFHDRGAALDHYARRYLFRRERDATEAAAMFERAREAIDAAPLDELRDEDHACLFVAEGRG